MYSYDYVAYMDYMDLDVRCPRKAIKLNHSLTHMETCNVYCQKPMQAIE